jgi:threonine dehydrogenase-like Zn-dependent dehydrogenase
VPGRRRRRRLRHGASTILLARAFPASRITGFDPHPPSIQAARKAASEASLGDRVSFEVASAQDFPGHGYGLACVFDALHDMGDPAGAARHIRSALAEDPGRVASTLRKPKTAVAPALQVGAPSGYWSTTAFGPRSRGRARPSAQLAA